MSRYLTNMSKSQGLEEKVRWASERSGIKVVYHDHPMPPDNDSWGDGDGYSPEMVPNDCSLEHLGPDDEDCGPFWRILEVL